MSKNTLTRENPDHLIKSDTNYHLIVYHKFPEVNTKIDELKYYLTLNNDRIFYPDNKEQISNFYKPELISTSKHSEDDYISVFSIKIMRSKITLNDLDQLKLNLILPFDHYTSISNLELLCLNNQ